MKSSSLSRTRLYLRQKKAVFIHIPKCAGTSIKKALAPYGEDVGHKMMSIYGEARFSDHYFFTCMRNTYERLMSFCLYMGLPPKHIKNMCEWSRGNAWKFAPADRFLDIDRVNRIIMYDNLQEDFDLVCRELEIPRIQLPTLNKTKHEHYSHYYTQELKAMVDEYYAKEIEMFDFKFEECVEVIRG